MKLKQGVTINDEEKFVKSHKAIVESNCSEEMKKPYRDRLELYYKNKANGK